MQEDILIRSATETLTDFSPSSTADTTMLNDPALLLFRRMNELSTKFCMSRPTGKTVVALNRKLDELEDVLLPSTHAQEEPKGRTDREFGILDAAEDWKPFSQSDVQNLIAPPSSKALAVQEVAMHDIDGRSQLLSRVSEAMEQLRQRQREMKVGDSHPRKCVIRRC